MNIAQPRRTTLMTAGLLSAMLGTLSATAADLELAAVFSNHMVLQRDQPIAFWGTCDPETEVTVEMGTESATTTSDREGTWRVTLPALPAGGPHRIVISAGDQAKSLSNVLMGDVWVCSGQSNMFWRLSQTDRADEFVPTANSPTLRLLQIEKTWDREPLDEADTRGWRECTPEQAERFSAVGYHFGRILNEELDVPIGLIQSAWGGTPLEAWTPMPTLEARPDVYSARIASLAEYDMSEEEAQRMLDEAQQKHEDFAAFAWKNGTGQDAGWHQAEFDDSAWDTVEMPGYIDGKLGSFDGIVWLRRSFTLDADAANNHATLRLGRVDDFDETFVNGTMVGNSNHSDSDGRLYREYDVPADILREGENVVAIRLMDVRSSGGIVPEDKGPAIDTSSSSAGESTIDLAGPWRYAIGFNARDHGGFPRPASHAVPVGRTYRRPAVLFNAMINPLASMGVKGVIWYQGESNSGRGDEYAEMFPDMINAWRDTWRGARHDDEYTLPFYFVQLPNYRAARAEPHESSWAELRDAQRTTLDRTEHTGMAITVDIGNPGDIHPTNKVPVAERLARVAMNDLYGKRVDDPTGPLPVSAKTDGSSVVVAWTSARGLKTTDGNAPTTFELAGPDGRFYTASATIKGSTTVVTSEKVSEPTMVRYAWADNPQVNLVNREELPASTFELAVETE